MQIERALPVEGRSVLYVPPVDVKLNAPDFVMGRLFREANGVTDDEILLVTVSRLILELKSESLLRTISSMVTVGRGHPVRYLIVGDGNARGVLEDAAKAVNSALGRRAVQFAGEMIDPRPAYASADVIVGMGGSALRGMAFEKPVIVVGEGGFSRIVTPESSQWFLYHGIYGRCEPASDNTQHISDLSSLIKIARGAHS